VRHPVDIAIMYAVLWLLGSMMLDYLTPKELTAYMIAAATAPAVIGTGLCYYLQFPKIDFAVISATLWLVAALTIEWISPVPLPSFLIGAALAPALIVGAILHWHRYRSGDGRQTGPRRPAPTGHDAGSNGKPPALDGG
jgi:hypothetical protein